MMDDMMMISRIQIALTCYSLVLTLGFWFLEIKLSRISMFKTCKDVLKMLH